MLQRVELPCLIDEMSSLLARVCIELHHQQISSNWVRIVEGAAVPVIGRDWLIQEGKEALVATDKGGSLKGFFLYQQVPELSEEEKRLVGNANELVIPCIYGKVLVVAPEYWNSGVGVRLLRHLEKEMEDRGVRSMRFWVKPRLKEFYERLGAIPYVYSDNAWGTHGELWGMEIKVS